MKEIPQTKPLKIGYSDLQIIEGMKKGDDPNLTRRFQQQFFDKYKGYIYKIALQRCVRYNDPQAMASDITQLTFIKAFGKIIEFDLSKETDHSRHQYIIKAWLGIIANNCFNKEYAQRKGVTYLDDLKSYSEEEGYDFFESLYGDEIIEIPNIFRSKLRAAMNSLTEIQRHVIETYASEGCINDPSKKLSKTAMEFLCKTHETSTDNIRQIKKRTLDKIKKHCFSN